MFRMDTVREAFDSTQPMIAMTISQSVVGKLDEKSQMGCLAIEMYE